MNLRSEVAGSNESSGAAVQRILSSVTAGDDGAQYHHHQIT
jgi:hypothetical protein